MWFVLISSSLVFLSVVLFAVSIGDTWDLFTRRHVADYAKMLDTLSMNSEQLGFYMRLWGAVLVGGVIVIAFVLRMPPVAVAVGFFIYASPRLILNFLIQQRRIKLRDQMAGAAVALSNSCRAGLTLAQGLETVSAETPLPLAAEFRRIVLDYQLGRSLSAAITDTKNRLKEDSFSLFASAILVSLDRGGKTTEALERIANSLKESQRVERKLASDTASGKSIVNLLAAFPILYLAGSYLLYPTGTTYMFTTLIGQAILSLVLLLVYVGFRWSQKVVEIKL